MCHKIFDMQAWNLSKVNTGYNMQHAVRAGVELAEIDLGALLMSPKLWACGE